MTADRTVEVYLKATVDQYNQAMGSAAAATGRVATAGQKASVAAKAAARTMATMAVAAATAGVAAVASVAKVGVAYNALEQRARAAFTTVLGDGEKAARMMDKVAQFSKTSPFPRQVFIESTQELLAFGMAAKNVVPTLSAVQDAVAAAGGTSTEISEVVHVLAKITSTGKITALELKELGYRGIDAAKLIGSRFNMTSAEVRKAIHDGKISGEQAMAALVQGMNKTFGGAAENVKNTWVGATDRVKAAIRDVGSVMAEPFVAKAGGGMALDWANQIADVLRTVENQAPQIVEIMTVKMGKAFGGFSEKLSGMQTAVANFKPENLLVALDKIEQHKGPIAGVAAAITALGLNGLPMLRMLGLGGINPVVAGLAAMTAADPALRSMLKNLATGLEPAAYAIKDLAVQAVSFAEKLVQTVSPTLEALVSAAGPVASTLADMLGSAFQTATAVAIPLTEVLGTLVQLIAQLPTPFLATAVAVYALHTPLRAVADGFTAVGKQMITHRTALIDAGKQHATFGAGLAVVKDHAVKAGKALKTAFVGNLPFLAISAALAVASTAFAKHAEKITQAREAQRAYAEAINGVDTSAGRASETLKTFTDRLYTDDGNQKAKTNQALADTGLRIQDIQWAALEGAEALDALLAKTKEQVAAAKALPLDKSDAALRSSWGDEAYLKRIADLEQQAGGMTIKTAYAVEEFIEVIYRESDALREAEKQERARQDASKTATAAYEKERAQIEGLNKALQAQIDIQDKANKTKLTVIQTERAYQDSQIKLKTSLQDAQKAMDKAGEGTDKYKLQQHAAIKEVEDNATAALDWIKALAAGGEATDVLARKTGAARQEMVRNLTSLGLSEKKARQYADAIGLIPGNIVTKAEIDAAKAYTDAELLKAKLDDLGQNIDDWQIDADTGQAINALNGAILTINQTSGKVEITADPTGALTTANELVGTIGEQHPVFQVDADTSPAQRKLQSLSAQLVKVFDFAKKHGRDASAVASGGRGHTTKAAGGPIVGPGTGTSDSVAAWLSNGEHVVTAKETRAAGGHQAVAALRQAMLRGQVPALLAVARGSGRFAKGGPVGVRLAEPAVSRLEKQIADWQAQLDRISETQWRRSYRNRGRKISDSQQKQIDRQEKAEDKQTHQLQKQIAAAQAELEQLQQTAERARLAAEQETQDRQAQRDKWQTEFDRMLGIRQTADSYKASLSTQLRRGQFTVDSLADGYQRADQVREAAALEALDQATRDMLTALADRAENRLQGLYSELDGLTPRIEQASQAYQDLGKARDQVAVKVTGETRLTEIIGKGAGVGYKATGGDVSYYLAGRLERAKRYASLVDSAVKAGFSGVFLEDLLAGATVAQATELLEALLTMTPAEVAATNSTFEQISLAANQAGTALTKAMFDGGVDAAKGLLEGLQSQEQAIRDQIAGLGQTMQNALREALDIHSPSRVMAALGVQAGQGLADGLEQTSPLVGLTATSLAGACVTPLANLPAPPPVTVSLPSNQLSPQTLASMLSGITWQVEASMDGQAVDLRFDRAIAKLTSQARNSRQTVGRVS